MKPSILPIHRVYSLSHTMVGHSGKFALASNIAYRQVYVLPDRQFERVSERAHEMQDQNVSLCCQIWSIARKGCHIDGKCDVKIIHTRSEISDACKKVLFLEATIVSAALISSVGRSFA